MFQVICNTASWPYSGYTALFRHSQFSCSSSPRYSTGVSPIYQTCLLANPTHMTKFARMPMSLLVIRRRGSWGSSTFLWKKRSFRLSIVFDRDLPSRVFQLVVFPGQGTKSGCQSCSWSPWSKSVDSRPRCDRAVEDGDGPRSGCSYGMCRPALMHLVRCDHKALNGVAPHATDRFRKRSYPFQVG